MTKLGLYLSKKSVNKAKVSRRIGISASRISELTLNLSINLKAQELYLITLAIDNSPCVVLHEICKDLKLVTEKKDA